MKIHVLLAFILCGSAAAHHGWAAFESKDEVTFKATVTDFHFVNPHSVLEFEAKDENGKVSKWQGEMTSPAHLKSRGWKASSLAAGDELLIVGYPAKNGTASMRIMKILRPNGQELKLDGDRTVTGKSLSSP